MSSFPPLLIPLMLINLTAHMALSGGRVAGSIFALKHGASEFSVGVLLALYAFLPVLTALRIGRWVDESGAKKALYWGIGCVIVGTGLPTLVLATWTMFLSAALVGFGYNVISIALQNSVGRISDGCAAAQRLSNFGWFALSHSLSSTIGPFVVGVLIDAFGYRVAFSAMLVSSIVALACVLRSGAQLPTALPAKAHNENSKRFDGLREILASAEMRRIYWVSITMSVVWDLFIVLLPIIGHKLHFSASVIGTVFALFAIGTFTIRFLTGYLSRRFREWEIMRVALAVIALVLAALPFVESSVAFMCAGFFLGAALGAGQPNLLSLLHASAPSGRSGEAVGLRAMFGNASSVSVPVAFGASVAFVGLGPILWMGMLIVAGAWPLAHRGVRARRHERAGD